MRVTFCISNLVAGGAERQLHYAVAGLEAHGATVDVAFVEGLESMVPTAARGQWFRLGPLDNRDPRLLLRLRRFVRQRRPDLVQSWSVQQDVVAGLLHAYGDLAWVLREPNSSGMYGGGWRVALRDRLARRADGIVANSNAGLAHWRARGHRGPQALIRNAVPARTIAAAPRADLAALGLRRGLPTVAFVGRFEPEKNVVATARAIARAAAMAGGQGVLVGGGSELRAVEAAVAGAPVAIAGFRDDVWSLLGATDVVVLASFTEGEPNVLLEAAAAGCAIVAADIAPLREMLAEDQTVFVDPASEDDIVRGISRALADGGRRSPRVQVAQAMVVDREPAAIGLRYLEFYEKVLRSGR